MSESKRHLQKCLVWAAKHGWVYWLHTCHTTFGEKELFPNNQKRFPWEVAFHYRWWRSHLQVFWNVVKWLTWRAVKRGQQTMFSAAWNQSPEVHIAGLPCDFFPVISSSRNDFMNVGIHLLMCCWKSCCAPVFGDFGCKHKCGVDM